MELTELQKTIINAPEPKIAVQACAAALKTSTLTEKVRQLLRDGTPPTSIAVITFTRMAAAELVERLGDDYKDGLFVGTIHSLGARFLALNGLGGRIAKIAEDEDFDKIFELCKDLNIKKSYDWVLVDEMQDTGEKEMEFIFDLIDPEHYFVVFDTRQCQPKGTKVTLWDGTEKNIEDIEVGDKLITYSKTKSFQGGKVHNAKNYQVLETEHHFCNEPLVKITLENGKSSIYSPEHICIVNLTDIQENYLVYLMCDENNRFRVGKSQFTCNENNNAYRAKMVAEKCKKIWILKAFKTDKEARVYEDKISYKYQIPQITFQLNKTTYTKEDIAFIYEGLDTYQSAKRCLEDHHRKIEYPFCFVGDNNHYASNAYNQCYACNILPNNMKVLCFNQEEKANHRREPSRITKVEYVEPQEVYSLEVEGNHNYVADGILTHNCIYSFKGARPDLLMKYLRGNAKFYPLSQNFRNSRNILSYAQRIISRTGNYDDSECMYGLGGEIYEMEYNIDTLVNHIKNNPPYKEWAILTRTNADVTKISNDLARFGIPTQTFKQGDLTKSQLEKMMKENKVKVLTVHSAKGLAWDHVAVYDLRWWNDEEVRINYVAATRARKSLLWMSPPRKRRKPRTYDW